ncbi:olfactory receptor 52B6-like [Xenopus laevis]|uniref:Olfactory receptor 52B6-like n=1 Tax=Xenopus laevis TaxID=8355 RepID=A0A8J1M6G0_XENLA|nr:olfactory receptor 52B6-like [Xenopus laevis]
MESGFNLSTNFILLGLVEMERLNYLFSTISLVMYLFILLCNLIVVLVVLGNESLHQPMYILIANLVMNGLFGSSAFFPKLLVDLFSSSVMISRTGCFIQAFCLMIAAYCQISTFTIMACDTYVAVCHPLRYGTLMTSAVALNLIIGSFFFNLTLVLIIVLLAARLPLCGSTINSIFCDNMSIFILSCVDTSVNKLYGSIIFVSYLTSAIFIIGFSYIQIFLVCLKVSEDAGKKAIHTVVTHLLNFSIFLIGGLFIFIRYRMENARIPLYVHILLSVTAIVCPPMLTPLIYGIRTKALKIKMVCHLQKIYQ